MTAKPEQYEELTRLISALLERRISESERAKLETLLQNDSAARRLYMQMIDQEVELSCLPVAPQQPVTSSPRDWRQWWLAAAAVLVIGTVFALVLSREQSGEWVEAPKPAVTSSLALERWSEDFEGGLLRGWTGVLVSTNLPKGSKYGVGAIVREYPVGGPVHVIQLPEDWNRGLFALTAGSTLHVSYRLGNRGHVNVFMHTIPADPAANDYQMYQFLGAPFSSQPGEWQTASIPFSKFIRKVVVEPAGTREFVGGPPEPGELVTTLAFSSIEPIHFVIDRVWVTPLP